MNQNLYPLRAALAVAGSSPGRFHNHVGTGAVDCALALIGDADAHLTPPRRGAGAGTGGGRLISAAATVAVAIALQLMPRGVSAADAFRIAGTFTFLGEMGDGLRAFVPGGTAAPRPAGGLFPADLGDTFLAVLPAALDAPQGLCAGPRSDRPGNHRMGWGTRSGCGRGAAAEPVGPCGGGSGRPARHRPGNPLIKNPALPVFAVHGMGRCPVWCVALRAATHPLRRRTGGSCSGFLCLPGQVHNPPLPCGAPAFGVVARARRRAFEYGLPPIAGDMVVVRLGAGSPQRHREAAERPF